MTATLPARTRSVMDRRSTSNLYTMDSEQIRSTRPVSWHPNFQPQNTHDQVQEFQYQRQFQQPIQIPQTMYANGLITPNFQAQVNDQYDCPEYYLDQTNQMESFPPYQQAQSFMPQKTELIYDTMDTNPFGMQTCYDALSNQTWMVPMNNLQGQMLTAPTSPEFLPMPETGEPFNFPETEEVLTNANEELVGLGLYDSPAQAQSSTLLFTGSLPVRRKSLKLEESFVPSSEPDEDDDAESEPDPASLIVDSGEIDHITYQTQYQDNSMLMAQGFVPNVPTGYVDAEGIVVNYDPYGSQTWV